MSNSTTLVPIYIYVLKDPFTDEIRYIGKSIRPKERLTNECNEHSNTHRCHWIQSIIAKGSKPIQIIIEELAGDADWKERERYWIAYGRAQGWPLTNGTDGGDGVTGLSPEARDRITKASRGRKATPETRMKIGMSSKGRPQSVEARQKRSNALKGRQFSESTRAKISANVSKLTDAQVQEILELLSRKVSQYTIADMFGVHQTTISNINRGKFYVKPHNA